MAKNGPHRGGRKPGSVLPKTLEKIKVQEQLRQRTLHIANNLFDYQLGIARGTQYLFRIDKTFIHTGKGPLKGYYKNEKPVLVESAEEIRMYLEEKVTKGDEEDDQDPSAAYYFMTVKDPNNNAIDSMFDRVFGKATNNVDLTSGGEPIALLGGDSKKYRKQK